MTDSFPRQYARTRRLTLGEPRTITVSPDGQRVVFVRSRAGDDPVNCLWLLDVASGTEQLVADPAVLLGGEAEANLPPEERARRERAREAAGGVVSYATDAAVTVVAFPLAGRLFVAGLLSARARELNVTGPVFDPRPDPMGRRLAYVSGSSLRIAELDGRSWELAGEGDNPDVSWGSAEFIAAEEMGRSRGYWWSPDGTRLAVTRVDTALVPAWWIGDPAQPAAPPVEIRYPSAGSDNAAVTLHVFGLEGGHAEVEWDRQAFPYLTDVSWPAGDEILITVQSRDQRRLEVLAVDPGTGTSRRVFADVDEVWVDLVPGVPARLDDGRLVMTGHRDGVRRLLVAGEPVTDDDVEVRAVVAVTGDDIVFVANVLDGPTEQHIWRWRAADGAARASRP